MRFVLLGLLLAACSHERHVFVPNTPEARDCREECNRSKESCLPDHMEAEQYTSIGQVTSAQREKEACEDKRKDCLLTCPGAYEQKG